MKSLNANSSRRRQAFVLILLLALGVTGVCWGWNWIVHLPDPNIKIHTNAEAVDAAREFLVATKRDTSNYDMSHVSNIESNRYKGRIEWFIRWKAKVDATRTNKLSVYVHERGELSTGERIGSNQVVWIKGF
ncbi:MAG TPA: hypothetical protein VK968_16945, partial [Roseimicrobium sp.]|nr:hypothetical protein [Roseimicrobium sp.]